MGEKWTEYRLKELGKIISGDTPNTKKKEYFGGSIPWITPKDLSNRKERYIQYGERMITEKGFASCATHKIPPLSILFSSRAPIGRMAITKGEVCTSQGFKAIVPNETVDYLFLYYLLKYYRDKIITMGSGSTFREITTDVLSNISVRIPKKREEQERIGRILDSLDSKIELNYRINDNLEEQAVELFKLSFPMERNEIKNNKEPQFSQDRSGGTVTLGDMASLWTATFYPQKVTDTLVEHYSIPAYDKARFPIFERSTDIKSAKYYVDSDCFMISKLNPAKKRTWLPYCMTENAICSTEFIVYKAKRSEYKYFLFSLINDDRFQQFICSHLTGSSRSRQRVLPKETLKYKFTLPSDKRIQEYTNSIQPIFTLIKKNYMEINRLEKLRNDWLIRLMQG